MKNTRIQFSLILAVILIFTLLSTSALAAGKLDVAAKPVQYTLFVNGKSTSLWAHEIDGDIYFKLRDLAMVLNGTEKQFNVSWDGSKSVVSLTSGTTYTPVGGELSEPPYVLGTIARLPTTTFYIDNKIVPLRTYTLNNAHYVMLSDLATNLFLSATYDEEKHTIRLSTQIYDTGIYSFSLPEGWSADGSTNSLSFTRSDKSVGSFIIRNYDPDKPISQFEDDHRTTLSSEDLSGFDYPATKAVIRATQPAAAQDDSYVDELHIYIMLADLRCAFDLSFDSAKVDEQTAMEIAKSFVPKKAAIKMNAVAFLWAQGIESRDGRAQYELLSAKLQSEFKDYYENVNWVTGVSSPWISSYVIEIIGNYAVVFFENMTSEGFAGYTIDTLSFSEESGQIKICGIDGYNNFYLYSVEKGVIPLQFKTEALAYEKLPILDKAQVAEVLEKRTENGIIQVLYQKPGDDLQFYLYLTIDGVNYDLGYMGYGYGGPENKPSRLESWGVKTEVLGDSSVYMFVRLHGVAYVSSAYLTILDGVPYLLYEFDGWGIQYDIDGDGAVETTANAGGSTSEDYILYEWDMRGKTIRHVKLMDMLTLDVNKYNITTYNTDENLFRASSRDHESGEWTESAYKYKDGKLIFVE